MIKRLLKKSQALLLAGATLLPFGILSPDTKSAREKVLTETTYWQVDKKKYDIVIKSYPCNPGKNDKKLCFSVYGLNEGDKNLQEVFNSSLQRSAIEDMVKTPGNRSIKKMTDLCNARFAKPMTENSDKTWSATIWTNAALLPTPVNISVTPLSKPNETPYRVRLKAKALGIFGDEMNLTSTTTPSRGSCTAR